jgi:ribose transport system substrate-binding protein
VKIVTLGIVLASSLVKRFILVLSLLLLAGCTGSGERPAGRRVIGVTLLTQTHAFFKDLEAGVRAAAAEKGFDVAVVACEMDPARQAAQIEDFVAQRVAAILAAPCDSSAIAPALAVPERAGIPVFTADIAAHGGAVKSHVASDNVQGGRLAGQALADLVGGRGKVVIIDHPTVASVQERVRGFEKALEAFPGMTIVARQSSDGQRARATQVMEDLLQAHPDLVGVFGINDDSALGAVSVLEAAGRTNVVVVGYDATEEAQAAIRRGSPLKADVIQYPRRIGEAAIGLIARHLAGEQVPARVDVEVGIVTAQSLARQ